MTERVLSDLVGHLERHPTSISSTAFGSSGYSNTYISIRKGSTTNTGYSYGVAGWIIYQNRVFSLNDNLFFFSFQHPNGRVHHSYTHTHIHMNLTRHTCHLHKSNQWRGRPKVCVRPTRDRCSLRFSYCQGIGVMCWPGVRCFKLATTGTTVLDFGNKSRNWRCICNLFGAALCTTETVLPKILCVIDIPGSMYTHMYVCILNSHLFLVLRCWLC